MKLRRWRSSSPDDNIPLPPEEGTERRSPEEQKERELRRRRLELTAALITVLVVMISSWWQLSYLEGDSWLFLVLLNINIILMLVVLFLVSRSVVKLFVERKRKIFGSRLRTRLVLAFISISFIPVLIMFLAANRVVVTSVDYWFKSQVENSMQDALQIGQNFYAAAARSFLKGPVRQTLQIPTPDTFYWENWPLFPPTANIMMRCLYATRNKAGWRWSALSSVFPPIRRPMWNAIGTHRKISSRSGKMPAEGSIGSRPPDPVLIPCSGPNLQEIMSYAVCLCPDRTDFIWSQRKAWVKGF